MKRYEVIESRVYQHKTRKDWTASVYGACPWNSPSEAKEWDTVHVGWTIRDNVRGTVGVARGPFATQGEAEAFMAERPTVFRNNP